MDKLKKLLTKFFNRDVALEVTPYKNKNRPAFFSSANIFQFDKTNINHVKITNVGEKEHFVDLIV